MRFLHPPDGRLITTPVSGRLKVIHPLSAAVPRVIKKHVYPSEFRAEEPNGTMVAIKLAMIASAVLTRNLGKCLFLHVCMLGKIHT